MVSPTHLFWTYHSLPLRLWYLLFISFLFMELIKTIPVQDNAWWRHHMDIFSTLLAICAGNSPVTCEFPAQRLVTWSFDVFIDLHLTKRLSKQWWGCWFETPPCPLWRHCNGVLVRHTGFLLDIILLKVCTLTMWISKDPKQILKGPSI